MRLLGHSLAVGCLQVLVTSASRGHTSNNVAVGGRNYDLSAGFVAIRTPGQVSLASVCKWPPDDQDRAVCAFSLRMQLPTTFKKEMLL